MTDLPPKTGVNASRDTASAGRRARLRAGDCSPIRPGARGLLGGVLVRLVLGHAGEGGGGAACLCPLRIDLAAVLGHFARQAAGDDLGDAVAAHADPVEDVGGVHGAFLVGDDDELGAVGEAPDQLQEAIDVGVVEGGLDLVEDVEGAGPGEEDGEDEGDRDQRLLAAGEQRELAGRLAGRGDLDLDAELLALFLGLLVARGLVLGRRLTLCLGIADRRAG